MILNAASSPAVVLSFLLLAFHAELGVMTSVILQLVILWTVVGLALAKLAANQRIMNVVFVVFGILALTIFIAGLTFAMKNGSATPFSWHDATIPNFAVAGFLYGTVLLYLLGVETPYNMGAEFLSVRKSGPRMILWGSAALVAIYLLTTLGTMMALPSDEIDAVTGVIGMLDVAGFPGLMEICAIVLALIIVVALMTYQVAYSRLIFVSGLERHLPRIFTHLNPRTRNPVSAILIQGVISSLILVALYSQSSLVNTTIFLQGGLSTVWLISGFFFLFPVVVARKKYADRYANETVLADTRRHGRRLDHRDRGHDRHDRRRLLLVREDVAGEFRRRRWRVDDVGRQHQPRHGRPRCRRLLLRQTLGPQDIAGGRARPSCGAGSRRTKVSRHDNGKH